mmetsp:Transcript_28714/g.61223  ORF Transcript_28714/g.61223 Transcript_28714/m.61223 type:complete len:505 (-) Transcript_28714:107-1621(-)
MTSHLSYEHIFKWAFALSPFPAYLPQYFSIMEQLARASVADSNDDNSPPTSDETAKNNGVGTATQPHIAIDRGGGDYHLRKRNNLHDSPTSMRKKSIVSPPISGGAVGPLGPGTPSKPLEGIGEDKDHNNHKLDTGLSRATVLLLLSSHLLRLLYFHGLILEEQRLAPSTHASAGIELDELVGASSTVAASVVSSKNETSALQYDLLGQSISMILTQLLLLNAMMMLRRKQLKRHKRRMSDYRITGHESTGSLISSTMVDSSRSDSMFLSTNHSYDHNDSSPTANNHTNTLFSQINWRHFSRAMTSHIRHLLSPHNILQKHTLLEYLELLFLSSLLVKLVFDYHWYPLYRMKVVEWLKHTSIVLESCLALPQAIRNHRKGTTEGLSVVMVGGWVAGDFFKLCYFLFNMIRGGDNGNNVFVLGCLVSISLDSIVAIQMVQSHPVALEWQQRILRSVRHWKTNKDDDAGESLLINNNGQKKDGLFVSFLRAFFQWARGIRPPSNTS